MECNKGESLRARSLAEEKFRGQDFAGAKRLLLKAMRLDPSLEGLSQMLPVIDVHIFSQQTVGDGEIDWYGILQVDETASDAAIKSQYKKLVLLFHPDKNKGIGADNAFKLIRDAWNVLSDKSRKLQHDSKRRSFRPMPSSSITSSQEDQICISRQSSSNKPNSRNQQRRQREVERKLEIEEEQVRKENEITRGNEEKEGKQKKRRHAVMKTTKAEESKKKVPKETQEPPETDLSHQMKEDSEHLVISSELSQIDQLKRCIFQRETYETRAQQRKAGVCVSDDLRYDHRQGVKSRHQQVQEIVTAEEDSEGLDNQRQGRKRKKNFNDIEVELNDGEGCVTRRKTRGATNSLRDKQHQAKYEEEKQYHPFISRCVLKPESISPECTHNHHGLPPVKQSPYEGESENPHAVLSQKVAKVERKASLDRQTEGLRASELTDEGQGSEEREMLLLSNEDERRRSLRADTVLSDSNIEVKEATFHISTRITRRMLREGGKQVFGTEEAEGNVLLHSRAQVVSKRLFLGEAGLQLSVGELLEVSPSQFNNFDCMRRRRSFRTGQIWAVYDDDDGMPRLYCRFTQVSGFSLPFKAKFSWLEPTSKTNLNNFNFWIDGDTVEVGCGEFEAGETAVTEHINIFSHCVSETFKEDPVEIYPLKCEIWAVFKDGNYIRKMKGTEEAAGKGQNVGNSYEVVEILEDFVMERGVPTVRLLQAPGFTSVFCRQKGPKALQCFAPSQVPVFSHRILAWKIAADVNLGLLGEAWELDPASLPESMVLCSTPKV